MRRALVEVMRKLKTHPQPLPIKEGSKAEFTVLIDGRDNYVFDELQDKPIYIVG